MSYTTHDYQSKKALKEDVAPGLGPDLTDYTGDVYLEGPHYPKPHKWYAKATLLNGIITKVS